jgi:hypothetical protein
MSGPASGRLALWGLAISAAVLFVPAGNAAHANPADPPGTCRELAPDTPNPHPCDWPHIAVDFAQGLDPNTFAEPIEPDGAIEERYFEEGPWSVRVDREFACCDSAGNSYAVYRPRHLGVGGIRHPLITWGNGSDGSPEGYDFFLRHVASWGFVVIATREDQTGDGDEILDAARFAVAENDNPSSIFFGKLATDRVGAMGHSQGAAGALNALRKSDGLIRTAILFHIPENGCWSCPPETPTGESGLDEITWGSVFLVTGSNDPPVSSAAGNKWWYEELPDSIPKARGRLLGPTHGDITGQPGCTDPRAALACFNGVFGYLGYSTAWMMDRLWGDAFARGAFISDGSGEIFDNSNWDHVVTDNIAARKGKTRPRPKGEPR